MTTENKDILRVHKTRAQLASAGIKDTQWGWSTDELQITVRSGDNYYRSPKMSLTDDFEFESLTASGTLGVTGLATLATLAVTSTSTFTGLITANGGLTLGAGDDLIGSSTSDITMNTNKFTVAGATGNTVVAGTLGVTGAMTGATSFLQTTTGASSIKAVRTSNGTVELRANNSDNYVGTVANHDTGTTGSFKIVYTTTGGTITDAITISEAGAIAFPGTNIVVTPNLPTSAGATGTLWNDSGTVKVA